MFSLQTKTWSGFLNYEKTAQAICLVQHVPSGGGGGGGVLWKSNFEHWVQICYFWIFEGEGRVLWKPNFEHWVQICYFWFFGGGGYFGVNLSNFISEVSDNFHFRRGGGGGTLEWRVLCRFWTKKWTTKSEPLKKCVGSQIVSWRRLKN